MKETLLRHLKALANLLVMVVLTLAFAYGFASPVQTGDQAQVAMLVGYCAYMMACVISIGSQTVVSAKHGLPLHEEPW